MVDSETSKQVQCVTRFVEAQQNLPSDDLGGMDDEFMDTQQEEEQECVYGKALKFARDIGGQQEVVIRQERENLRRFDKPGYKIAALQQIFNKILLELESMSINQKWLMYSDLRNILGQSHSQTVGSFVTMVKNLC